MRVFALLLFLLALPQARAQLLTYTTSWLGNSQPAHEGTSVQDCFNSLWTSPDGTCYTNSGWDEEHYASGVYRQGKLVGRMNYLDVSGGKGAISVAGDDQFIYFGYYDVLRRYLPNGESGYWTGADGKPQWGIHVVPTSAGHGYIRGLAVDKAHHNLYVAIGPDGDGKNSDDIVQIYSTDDMNAAPVVVNVKEPREVAASGDGTFWVISSQRTPRQPSTWSDPTLIDTVLHFKNDGTRLPQTLTGPPGFFPTALCFDGKKRLLVADDGPGQNVRIYSATALKGTHPALSGTFGVTNGVQGGSRKGALDVAGTAPRFHGLCGLGIDAQGNLYIAQSAFGPDWNFQQSGGLLECYTPSGKRLWQARSLEFVDGAAVDPASEAGDRLSVFTKYHRYALDMAKTVPGTEGVPVAFTVNPYKHIYDYRFVANGTFGWSHVSQAVTVQGHKLVVMGGMDNGSVHIYRQSPSTEGETLIECAVFYASSVARDLNADGRFDGPGEVTTSFLPGGGDVCKSWFLDSHGDVWESYDGGGKTGVRRYTCGGFDAHGTPIWSATAGQFEDVDGPVPFSEVRRVLYDAATDTLTLSGYSSNDDPARNLVPGIGYGNTDNKSAGSVVARYDNWSKGNRVPRWSRIVYVPSSTNPASEILGLAAAGDYVFTGHSGFGHEVGGPVLVYKGGNGTPVGEMNAQVNGVEASSGLDIPYPLSAYKRRNGEYLVFEETDGRGRVVMFRWHP